MALTEHDRSGKASFDDVYDAPDPRAYMRALAELDYQTPAHAQPVFTALAAQAPGAGPQRDAPVVDLCCGYGIVGMLVGHDVSWGELCARYTDAAIEALSTDELVAADVAFFAEHRLPAAGRQVGLDVAARAVRYARAIGVLDAGSDANLEEEEPDEELAATLVGAGLVTVVGGFGYIGSITLDRVLTAVGSPAPWVAAYVQRWDDVDAITATLADHGLRAERRGRLVRHRRFADDAEREYAIGEVRRLGLDPTGAEEEGYYHCELLVARPDDDVAATSLDELVGPAGG